MAFHFAPKSKMNDGKQTKRTKRKTNFINLEYSKRLCVFAFSNCNWPPDDSIEWQDKQQSDGYAAGCWWYVDARKLTGWLLDVFDVGHTHPLYLLKISAGRLPVQRPPLNRRPPIQSLMTHSPASHYSLAFRWNLNHHLPFAMTVSCVNRIRK